MNHYGILGSGSWATAIAKILTDNGHTVNWWIRNDENRRKLAERGHNPHYVSSISFDVNKLRLHGDMKTAVAQSEVLIIAIPSAYIHDALNGLTAEDFRGKKIISAIKGIIQPENLLLHQFMERDFFTGIPYADWYGVVTGPCHAEEVAAEKLSYLTISCAHAETAARYAADFSTPYIKTVVNSDVDGVQYAAVLKNIYAIGAGMAHGLDYGDNFLSVYIANAADEMATFLRKLVWKNNTEGPHNYAASAYLGDLLVTCYSMHSRNRQFGNYIGKGYSVKLAQLEMNMVAEGYNAAKGMHRINSQVGAKMPVAETIYRILWEQLPVADGFKAVEAVLV
jgi:glycerol-3-phosphate dehydrogenase (NAD(P)+)